MYSQGKLNAANVVIPLSEELTLVKIISMLPGAAIPTSRTKTNVLCFMLEMMLYN